MFARSALFVTLIGDPLWSVVTEEISHLVGIVVDPVTSTHFIVIPSR